MDTVSNDLQKRPLRPGNYGRERKNFTKLKRAADEKLVEKARKNATTRL